MKPINDNYSFCLLNENQLNDYPNFDDICFGENKNLSLINLRSEHKISFDLITNNQDKKLFIYDSIITQASSLSNSTILHLLKNLDNTIAYWEPGFYLPSIYQSIDNLPIFENIFNLLNKYPNLFSIKNIDYDYNSIIKNLEDGIYEIKNPYIPNENDFSAPYPSIDSSLGFFKFNPQNFNDFDKLFNIATKYISLKNCLTDENISLIINLALLKISFPEMICEEFYQIFSNENKKANSIVLDWKLANKNISNKKNKI